MRNNQIVIEKYKTEIETMIRSVTKCRVELDIG